MIIQSEYHRLITRSSLFTLCVAGNFDPQQAKKDTSKEGCRVHRYVRTFHLTQQLNSTEQDLKDIVPIPISARFDARFTTEKYWLTSNTRAGWRGKEGGWGTRAFMQKNLSQCKNTLEVRVK